MPYLKEYIKNFIIDILPKSVVSELNRRYISGMLFYFSQEGEDVLLDRIFNEKKNGFFVDVGAHHPLIYSNTHKFFLRGWRGINIDATPGSMAPFKQMRHNDINLEIGISDSVEELNYYIFDVPALNTFSKERAQFLQSNSHYKLINTVLVNTKPLKQVFEEYLPSNQNIDFLSVDVEGLDYNVLLSNDWELYRPYIVLIEEFDSSIDKICRSNTCKFLNSKGYEFFSKTYNTVFFRDIQQKS